MYRPRTAFGFRRCLAPARTYGKILLISARPSPRRATRGYSRPTAAVTSRHQRVAVSQPPPSPAWLAPGLRTPWQRPPIAAAGRLPPSHSGTAWRCQAPPQRLRSRAPMRFRRCLAPTRALAARTNGPARSTHHSPLGRKAGDFRLSTFDSLRRYARQARPLPDLRDSRALRQNGTHDVPLRRLAHEVEGVTAHQSDGGLFGGVEDVDI